MNKKVLFLCGLLIVGAITSFGIYKKLNSVDYLRQKVYKTVCAKEKGRRMHECSCAILYIEDYLDEEDYRKLLKHRLKGERVKAGKIVDTLSFREMIEFGQGVNMCIEILESSSKKEIKYGK